MTITPPANINYGRVVWQAVSDVVDGPDAATRPDFIAPTGEVTFVASTSVERNVTASPNPVSILRDPIVGVLDSEGYLCTPDATGAPAYRGLDLIATDDPDLNPTDWVYNVSYSIRGKSGRTLMLRSHQIYVPTDAVVDLTAVGPVDNATAIGIPQAEALAAQAVAAAADASAAASQALAAAAAAEAALSDVDAATAENLAAPDSETSTAAKSLVASDIEAGGDVGSAVDGRVAGGVTGKQDKSTLDEDMASEFDASDSALRGRVSAQIVHLAAAVVDMAGNPLGSGHVVIKVDTANGNEIADIVWQGV